MERGHLCGAQHSYKEECEEMGFCEIESGVNSVVAETGIYKTIFGDNIQYNIIKFQNRKKKNDVIRKYLIMPSIMQESIDVRNQIIIVENNAFNVNIIALKILDILVLISVIMEI